MQIKLTANISVQANIHTSRSRTMFMYYRRQHILKCLDFLHFLKDLVSHYNIDIHDLSNLKDTLVTFQFCEDTLLFYHDLPHATMFLKMYISYNEFS